MIAKETQMYDKHMNTILKKNVKQHRIETEKLERKPNTKEKITKLFIKNIQQNKLKKKKNVPVPSP
jgi:hypothetical protein